MADLFVTTASIVSNISKEDGRQVEKYSGITPSVKNGIWAERSLAPTNQVRPLKQAFLNAVVVP